MSRRNIIAVIWDCDKTLIDGYMQDPIFADCDVDPGVFWADERAEMDKLASKGIRVNRDTYYLNYFIRCAHDGRLPKLNNAKLREYGLRQKFYSGIPQIFEYTKSLFAGDSAYQEYGIEVEHYIVSTGFAETVRGLEIMQFVEDVWGCELIDAHDSDGDMVISDIVYTIDNTTKTRALFEINKGIGREGYENIGVNDTIPRQERRVQFENMIYIADGPSDIPAFSVINQYGGSTFAVYPKGNMKAMQQVERMRMDGRIGMYAEADYSFGTTAYMWIVNKILEIADRIKAREKDIINASTSSAPKHLV